MAHILASRTWNSSLEGRPILTHLTTATGTATEFPQQSISGGDSLPVLGREPFNADPEDLEGAWR
jgi:hypothetical protein